MRTLFFLISSAMFILNQIVEWFFLSFNDCEVIFDKLIHRKDFSKGNYANIIFQSQSSMRISYHDNDLSRFCFHSSLTPSLHIHSLAINKFCMNHFLISKVEHKLTETWILKFSKCLISLKWFFMLTTKQSLHIPIWMVSKLSPPHHHLLQLLSLSI